MQPLCQNMFFFSFFQFLLYPGESLPCEPALGGCTVLIKTIRHKITPVSCVTRVNDGPAQVHIITQGLIRARFEIDPVDLYVVGAVVLRINLDTNNLPCSCIPTETKPAFGCLQFYPEKQAIIR